MVEDGEDKGYIPFAWIKYHGGYLTGGMETLY